MKFSPIITIGRQYGSGGREVAKKLAQVMNVSFYDKELLAEASKDSGICQEVMETYDEKQGKRSFFSMMGGFQGRVDPGSMYLEMPLNHRIFLAQFDTIRKIADAGPCVIVGRCADYILTHTDEIDSNDVFNVFIYAPLEFKAKRAVELKGLAEESAKKDVRLIDKRRANHYNTFTEQTWGDRKYYHALLNSSLFGIDNTADIIVNLVQHT